MPERLRRPQIQRSARGASSSQTSTIFRGIWRHLQPRRRWQLAGLALLMLTSGLTDALSLGAVLPFLAVLVSPERLFDQPQMAGAIQRLGIDSPDALLLPLTVGFVAAALVAAAMRLLVLWCNKGYVQRVSHELSMALYRGMLYQPYQVHVAANTSEIITAVGKIQEVTVALSSGLSLISAGFTAIAVLATLLLLQPAAALMAFGSIGGLYALLIVVSRRRLARNSQVISHTFTLRTKALQEGLGGIRDVLLTGSQPFYCDLYRRTDWPYSRARAENDFIALCPRYVMEALGMVVLAVLGYGLSRQPGAGALPLLGTFALGAQRLLPAFQQMFAASTSLRGDRSSVQDVLKLLDLPIPAEVLRPLPPALHWQGAIAFDRVSFRFGEADRWVLREVSFTIPRGARVGFVGPTGSGKSTTLDILMGLLEPTEGRVLVDGLPLAGDRLRAWQQAIAHVPQHIYLADTTIAENIALGVPQRDIDLGRVRRAAQQAQIADFIEQGPEGYWARLGEQGIRLSGGQRQRVGIARALYRDASVLVFDEATSALDNATEKDVMAAIDNLSGAQTVLLVAHRLSTVKRCDWIVELSQGQVVAQGSYQDLLEQSTSFQRLAGA